jgi:3-oxoacyl-[acyl-carrier protein] reductase
LRETVKIIEDAGGMALACPTDVTQTDQIEKLAQLVKEKWGRLDILINNAGSALNKPFMQTSLDEFDELYRIDLRSVFAVSQIMVPLLKEDGGGSIINIASILGLLGSKGSAAYCAMKGGVVNLTRAMAAELGPDIRVNCLCPSHIITPMMQPQMDHLKQPGKWTSSTDYFHETGRVSDDMNGSILFFASDHSKWLTGNIFMIDGGLSCYV